MELYELKRSKNQYQNMSNSIIKIINVLSSTELNDELSNASRTLRDNYLLNGSMDKDNMIDNAKNVINDDIVKLRNVLNVIDQKTKNINKSITDVEIANNFN